MIHCESLNRDLAMVPVYAIAIVNWCAFFAAERWGRTRLLGLSDRDGTGCIDNSMIYLVYIASLFFGTVLLTFSNIYWFGEVLEEEHAFLLAISASNPTIHVLCDSFPLIRMYRNLRKIEESLETDAKLGELWGIAQSDVFVIRARNGGVFPEDLDVDTLREFRIRTSDLAGNPSPTRRSRIIEPRTLLHYVGTDRITIRMWFLYRD